VSESKQRWRLVFAREEAARFMSHLDTAHAWERALRRGNVPVATSQGFTPRPRLVFAAPLPLGTLAEHDLADLYLAERITRPGLRALLDSGLPPGYRVVDLYDVWVNAPAVATQLVAADYRLTLLGVDGGGVQAAVGSLLAAVELRREKRRDKKPTAYDLRPLILDLRAGPPDEAAAAGIERSSVQAAGLWMRLRHTQDQGSARMEEIVAALAQELGMGVAPPPGSVEPTTDVARSEPNPGGPSTILEVVRPVRERLWLAEDSMVEGS
jgi:radical SAM-linked protein